MERGLCDFQDIYVVSKREFPSLNNLKMGNALKGNIDSVHFTDDIHIAGWAFDKNSSAPVKEVCIYLNNELLGHATVGLQRPDVADHFQRADYLNSGWEFRADASILEKKLGARSKEAGLIHASIQNYAGEATDLFSPFEIDMMKDNASGEGLLSIKNRGLRGFLEKVAKKVLVSDKAPSEAVALHDQGSSGESQREYALARAYIDSVARDPTSFVNRVDADDEMYLYTKNNIAQKEAASYLYFKTGKEALQSIENIIVSIGKSFEHIQSFLDFASGYGRFTRFLIQEIDPVKIWVSDIYQGAVDFQVKYFKVNGFYSETDPHKLQFPRKFEIIYVGSLFSHLPANRFQEWLSRLYGILEDDGILIFSTHGESLCPPQNQLDPSGFTFLGMSESESLSVEEYGSTFVTKDWVERMAKKLGINYIYFLERELWAQDIYVVTRKNIPSLQKLMPNNYPKGNIESVEISEDGKLFVKGWAIEREIGSPVKEVRIYADDEQLGRATLDIKRSDVAEHFKQPKYVRSGWEYRGRCIFNNELYEKDPNFIIIKALIENHQDNSICLVSSYEQRA
jgi:SAM-dependent methyltransferase